MTAQNARYIKDINFVLLVGSISVKMNVQNDLRNSETRCMAWPMEGHHPRKQLQNLGEIPRGRVGISYEFKP